jgi:diguanylate cyclase (GGDEF)-like protein
MPALDPRSIIALGGFMALLMTVVLFFMRRSYPTPIGGLREWVWAPLLTFLSAVFFLLRGHIPELLSVLAGNLLLLGSTYLYYVGSQRYFGETPRLQRWAPLALVTAISLWGLLYTSASYSVRLFVVTVALLCIFVPHCLLYLRQPHRGLAAWFMLSTLALQAGVLLLRLVAAWLGAAGSSTLDSTTVQTLYVATYSLTILALAIGAILMVTEALRAKFEQLVAYDPLTGALSRSAWLAACQRELERAHRHQRPLSVLLIDLDHFKTVNDTYGHRTGDLVLIDFVQRAQGLMRAHDSVGRFGGEEFLVLLPETGSRAATFVAERIRCEVARPRGGLPVYTVSVGVASIEENPNTDTVSSLVERADQSMYRAKALGRNRTGWMGL